MTGDLSALPRYTGNCSEGIYLGCCPNMAFDTILGKTLVQGACSRKLGFREVFCQCLAFLLSFPKSKRDLRNRKQDPD